MSTDDRKPSFLAAVARVVVGLVVAALAFAFFYDSVMAPAMGQKTAAQVQHLQYQALSRLVGALN